MMIAVSITRSFDRVADALKTNGYRLTNPVYDITDRDLRFLAAAAAAAASSPLDVMIF